MHDIPPWVQILEAMALAFQAIATPILIAVGGFFAWYKFIRQGEHDPKLQPTIAATITVNKSTAYVVVTASVSNNGQVEVGLDLDASAIEMFTALANESDWEPMEVVDVFEEHEMVQPGETLEDKWLVEVDAQELVALGLRLTVVEQTANLSWVTLEMVLVDDNISGGANEDA